MISEDVREVSRSVEFQRQAAILTKIGSEVYFKVLSFFNSNFDLVFDLQVQIQKCVFPIA